MDWKAYVPLALSTLSLLLSFLTFFGNRSQKQRQELSEINSWLFDAWLLLGADLKVESIVSFGGRDKLFEAKRLIDKCITIRPSYSESYRVLGLYYIARKNSVKAIENFKIAIKLDRCNSNAFLNYAKLLSDQGDYTSAIGMINRAIEIDSHNKLAHSTLGNIFLFMKMDTSAENCFRSAIGIDSEYAQAYNNLGVSLERQGKLNEAYRSYLSACMLQPGFREAIKNLELIKNLYSRQGYKIPAVDCKDLQEG